MGSVRKCNLGFLDGLFVGQIARRLGAALLKVVLVVIIGYAAPRLILLSIYYR
ncbi:hypothetical protein H6F61_01325 [Cyanobacteria bacterium FACHB-472]|nr:hypothetical protein [Cyanobacteria bacterium FACHB-472]